MIVLKATQEKIFAVLQSIADIVDRRHVLTGVLLRESGLETFEPNKTARAIVQFFRTAHCAIGCSIGALLSAGARQVRQRLVIPRLRLDGFFSASKVNLRNAP